jgi:hypothetical protein
MPIIATLGKLRLEDHDFQVSLSYTVRPCLKTKQRTPKVEETSMGLTGVDPTIEERL